MQPTKQDVENALKELYEAMIEKTEASKAEEKAKQRKIKAHFRVSLARETVRALNQDINY